MKNKKELVRAIKFFAFSVSAGVIQIGSFTLMNEVFKWEYWVCYLIALVLSVIWNFTVNRKFTFKSSTNVPIAMLKVACYYAVFTPLSTLLEKYLTGIGWNEYIVTIMNMVINFVTEFLYQRFFVFGKSLDTNVKNKDGETAENAAENVEEGAENAAEAGEACEECAGIAADVAKECAEKTAEGATEEIEAAAEVKD